MNIDNETAYLLDPLFSKLTEFNLFVVNVVEGKRDTKQYTKLYFMGGNWVELYDNGQFECSNSDILFLLQQIFKAGILVQPIEVSTIQTGKILPFNSKGITE